jgi:hypothetical protein
LIAQGAGATKPPELTGPLGEAPEGESDLTPRSRSINNDMLAGGLTDNNEVRFSTTATSRCGTRKRVCARRRPQ